MKINRNMSAVMTNKNLLRTENKLSASMERLSSGFKINRAGDNPAGLAISHKMKAQIDGLDRAKSNTTDAQSLLRIADGALNETASILQRIRELCVQAGNDTNSIDERSAIQDEINKLTEEVDRISTDTEYNTKALLNGSSDRLVTSEALERLYVSDSVLPGEYAFSVTKAESAYGFVGYSPDSEGVIAINGVEMKVTKNMPEEDFFELLRDTAELAGCEAFKDTSLRSTYQVRSREPGLTPRTEISVDAQYPELAFHTFGLSYESLGKHDEEGNLIKYSTDYRGHDSWINSQEQVLPKVFSETATVYTEGNHMTITDLDGFVMDFTIRTDDYYLGLTRSVTVKVTDIGAMTIQMGANQYQDMDIRIPEVSAKSLYLDKVDVTIVGGPDRA